MQSRAPDKQAPKTSPRPSAQQLPKALSGAVRAPRRIARPPGGRAVVAVLGSVAALGASAGSAAAAPTARAGQRSVAVRTARRADPLPAGELALLGLVFAALSAAAPAIARPLLDRGVAGSEITQAEADAFIARLAGVDSTPAAADAAGVPIGTPTPAGIAVFQSVFNAIRGQLPAIAKPLLADAVDAQTITPAQATRIEQRIALRAHLGLGLPGADAGGFTGRTPQPLFTGRLP